MSVEVVLGSDGGVPVVVKRAGPGPGADRLDHEATVLARAAGPGVVAMVRHETGVDGGRSLVLGLAGPRSLTGARLSPEAAAAVVAALADVVARLHDAGLVHGRIAPDHVVLGADGRPVLCGFAGGGGTGGRRPADDDDPTGGVLLPADDVAQGDGRARPRPAMGAKARRPRSTGGRRRARPGQRFRGRRRTRRAPPGLARREGRESGEPARLPAGALDSWARRRDRR